MYGYLSSVCWIRPLNSSIDGTSHSNVIAVFLVRVPAVYLASRAFPDTLFPMGLATATGSLLSVLLCLFFFFLLTGKEKTKAV